MDVADVEEVAVGGILRTVVAADHEDMVLWRDANGNGVVERGRRGVVVVRGVGNDFGLFNRGIVIVRPFRKQQASSQRCATYCQYGYERPYSSPSLPLFSALNELLCMQR